MDIWVIVVANRCDPMEDLRGEGHDVYVQEVVGFFMTKQAAYDHSEAVWAGGGDAVDIIKVTPPAVACNHPCQRINFDGNCHCKCFDRDRRVPGWM